MGGEDRLANGAAKAWQGAMGIELDIAHSECQPNTTPYRALMSCPAVDHQCTKGILNL